MPIIGVATGCYYSKDDYDILDAIDNISKLGVDAIEISLGTTERLENMLSEATDLKPLEQFSFKSIHSPNIWYDRRKSAIDTLNKLYDLYCRIGADYIVFHPDKIPLKQMLDEFDWNVCYENIPHKNWNVHRMRYLFQKNFHIAVLYSTLHTLN